MKRTRDDAAGINNMGEPMERVLKAWLQEALLAAQTHLPLTDGSILEVEMRFGLVMNGSRRARAHMPGAESVVVTDEDRQTHRLRFEPGVSELDFSRWQAQLEKTHGQPACDYWVAEKTDGLRYLLVVAAVDVAAGAVAAGGGDETAAAAAAAGGTAAVAALVDREMSFRTIDGLDGLARALPAGDRRRLRARDEPFVAAAGADGL